MSAERRIGGHKKPFQTPVVGLTDFACIQSGGFSYCVNDVGYGSQLWAYRNPHSHSITHSVYFVFP